MGLMVLIIKTLFSTYGEYGEREEGDGMLRRKGKLKGCVYCLGRFLLTLHL